MATKKKSWKNEFQLSLFDRVDEDPLPPKSPPREPDVLEFLKARFEQGPEFTPEEYRRWIKILIHRSLKSVD